MKKIKKQILGPASKAEKRYNEEIENANAYKQIDKNVYRRLVKKAKKEYKLVMDVLNIMVINRNAIPRKIIHR